MQPRAALYLRVSTVRQAQRELSIPDQRLQVTAFCEAQGWEVVTEYLDPGLSATDDRRPDFQRMIDDAYRSDRPFDIIVVHSFSRFYRDEVYSEIYLRKLQKHGVQVVSVTQPLGDGPGSDMTRRFLAIFDEYQSKENAKHTLRGMQENARQGFWNGARPPYGYGLVEADRRGDKIKKRLDIDPGQAEVVRLNLNL